MKNIQDRKEQRMVLEEKLVDAYVSEEDQNNLLKFLEKKETKYMGLQRHKMGVEDFELLTIIGNGQVYAMKKLHKSEMMRRGHVEHVKAERNLLAEVDSNCSVKLYFSFQDDECLYLIMEYLPGEDVMTLLMRNYILTVEARFYVAETVLAINILQEQDLSVGDNANEISETEELLGASKQTQLEQLEDWQKNRRMLYILREKNYLADSLTKSRSTKK
ncbi:hypothetical protein V6N13_123419 [Hibiscus sabdariffa]